jgi:endonuclease/exonuclease/phosphatase family metal-dependent hydrolase
MTRRVNAVLAAAACLLVVKAPPSAVAQDRLEPGTVTPTCLEDVPDVTWTRWTASNQDRLDAWCASVGPPVLLAPATEIEGIGAATRLQILNWNTEVGGGRVEELIDQLTAPGEDTVPAIGRTALVLLLEEVYRGGAEVPESYPRGLRVPSAIRPRRPGLDVVALARRFNMFLAYVPSMRNGAATSLEEREDRGNAILSTEPLTNVRAIELPFGKQRRVAVAATVLPRGSAVPPLEVVAAHFDTGGSRVAQAEALAAWLEGLSGQPAVLGGDLNALQGLRDDTVASLASRMPLEACGADRTQRWPLRLDVLAFFVGRLDFMFSTLDGSGVSRQCETLPDAYGSDHVPVLLTLTYDAPRAGPEILGD